MTGTDFTSMGAAIAAVMAAVITGLINYRNNKSAAEAAERKLDKDAFDNAVATYRALLAQLDTEMKRRDEDCNRRLTELRTEFDAYRLAHP